MSKSDKKINPFLDKLMNQSKKWKELSALYPHIENINNYNDPPAVFEILNFNIDNQSNAVKDTIELLETEQEFQPDFTNFKWKIYAFIFLQDIFDSAIFETNYQDHIFQQWYFYYESKYLLTEILLAGFNGFYAASDSLIRVFL